MDCTRASCCERDEEQQRKTAAIVRALREVDPTQIAIRHRLEALTSIRVPPSIQNGCHSCQHGSCAAHSESTGTPADVHNSELDEAESTDYDSDLEDEDPILMRMRHEAIRSRLQQLAARSVMPIIQEQALEDKMKQSATMVVLYETKESLATNHLRNHLEQIAIRHTYTRFVRVWAATTGIGVAADEFKRLRASLHVNTFPALVCIRQGQLVISDTTFQFGDLAASASRLEQWLKKADMIGQTAAVRTDTSSAAASASESEDEDEHAFKCPKEGCAATFAHNHIDDAFFKDPENMSSFIEPL